jgi:KUP system potassium uptake protein
VLHERVLFIASVSVDAPRVEASERVKFIPVGAGIIRVVFYFGFMETPDVMAALRLACRRPELAGIDPENITYYFRRVMVIASDKIKGMAVWRKSLFAVMHLNANLPAAYFGVPPSQVVEVGLEVEI